MNRIISTVLTASALIFGVFPPKEAAAQTKTNDLLGAWTLVSITLEHDGKKTDFYGPDPQGQTTLEANGRVSVIITARISQNSPPTIASQELQKKIRPSCRGALPSSARTRSTRRQRR